MTRALSAALALAALTGPAMATPIFHQPPVPVPVGLLLTIDPFEGRHSFSPADGIDAYAGTLSSMARSTASTVLPGQMPLRLPSRKICVSTACAG